MPSLHPLLRYSWIASSTAFSLPLLLWRGSPSLPLASGLSYSFSQLLNYSSHWNLHNQNELSSPAASRTHHLEQSDSPSAPAAERPGSWGRAAGALLRLRGSRSLSPESAASRGPVAVMPAFRSNDGKRRATAGDNWECGEVAAVASAAECVSENLSPARFSITLGLR